MKKIKFVEKYKCSICKKEFSVWELKVHYNPFIKFGDHYEFFCEKCSKTLVAMRKITGK